MTERMDFFQRSATMMAFYTDGKYLDALQVAEKLAVEFPEENATTSFWRVCLLSRGGKLDEALKAMSTAMDQGVWWAEYQLRGEDDLASLQGLTAFETMVVECRRRHAKAQMNSKPNILIRLPSKEGPYPLLIALHARTSSPEREFQTWEPILKLGWMLAMPQSSQLGSPNSFVWDDTSRAREEIIYQYEQLTKKHSIDSTRVILAGMSQGAAMAIQVSLRRLVPVRGFFAVVPGSRQIVMEDFDELLASKHDIRGYLVVGCRDPRYEMLRQIHTLLNQSGIPCEMENHPEMGHEYPINFDQSIAKALKFLLKECK